MRAVIFSEHGAEDVLRTAKLPSPEPARGEVRVRVEACSVNHIDLEIRAGTSRFEHPWPHILGREAAGVVDAIGDEVKRWQIGDRVIVDSSVPCGSCAMCGRERQNLCLRMTNPGVTVPGAYAEQLVLPQAGLVACPANLPPEVAAILPIAFGTAWHMLVTLAQARPAQTVLILGASGGVGVASTIVATALKLKVIAVVGTPAKAARLIEFGAWHALTSRDVVHNVMGLTGGTGADIVIDLVGGAAFLQALSSVATAGVIVTAGAHAGEVVRVDLVELFRREVRVLGSRGHTRQELRDAMSRVDLSGLHAVVQDVLALESAHEAHRRIAGREGVGKLVLSTR